MAIIVNYPRFGLTFAAMIDHSNSEAKPLTPRPPLSISIIGWIMVGSGLMALPISFLRVPLAFFGVVMTGWSATAGILVLALAYILIGYGLLQLKPSARIAGIAFFALFALNRFVFCFVPESHAKMLENMRGTPFLARQADRPIPPPLPSAFRLLIISVFGVPLWFLVTRKRAFEQPPVESGGPAPTT